MGGVEGVEPANGWEGGLAELEDDESAAGFEDSAELASRPFGVRHVADAEGDRNDVHRGVVQGELHGVALDVFDA